MAYEVLVSKSAEKELASLPRKAVKNIVSILLLLEVNPRRAGCKKLKGFINLWRIRVGQLSHHVLC